MLKDLRIASLYSGVHAGIKDYQEAEDITQMLIEFAPDIDKELFCCCSYSPVNFNHPHFITAARHGKLISSTIARVS